MPRQHAIDAMCDSCIFDPEVEGTWRMQTEACELTDCALWPYRPKPRRKTPDRPLSAAVQPQYEGNQLEVGQGVAL